MKSTLLVISLLVALGGNAQSILFVNDNDLFPGNTDSVLTCLSMTTYGSTIDQWNIPDSGGVYPPDTYLDGFDLVIWYCSTDGAGLALWDGSAAGNNDLIDYIITGKPLWIIGVDALFQIYGTAPDAISAGDFAYDYMGVENYNAQSYGDDGSLGVDIVERLTGVPTTFPTAMTWIFPTHWWVDGVTSRAGALDMYQMGPTGYVLYGEVCMLDFFDSGNRVMSTFFDPALFASMDTCLNFMQGGIDYLLGGGAAVAENATAVDLEVYPNPASQSVTFTLSSGPSELRSIVIRDLSGRELVRKEVEGKKVQLDCENFASGTYLYVAESEDGIEFKGKLVVE